MYITCLDLEGVLVPEIWIAFAEASGIPELKRTTRDEPDYDKLMRWRLGILKERSVKYNDRVAPRWDDKFLLWPIPQNVIDSNTGAEFPQNPGWEQ